MNTGILIINILLLIGESILGFILLFGKSYLQKKGENTADKEDSQEIAMLTELGKNIATKQDIQEITDKVESIKASYNESLERHKIELQKEFEKTKYIINLCNTIDMSLTQLIAEAIKSNIDPEYDDRNIMYTAKGIYDFLHIHQARYGGNKVLDKLKDISFEIAKLLESDYPHISYDYKKIYIATLNEAASLFLLKFK